MVEKNFHDTLHKHVALSYSPYGHSPQVSFQSTPDIPIALSWSGLSRSSYNLKSM